MKYFWKKLSDEKPNSYKTGDWDGKMSDKILCCDDNDNLFVGTCYQGFIDGSDFCCFYDENDFDVPNVEYWMEIPPLL